MDFIDDSPEVSVPLLETWQIAALSERSEVIDAAFDALTGVFSMSDRDRFVTRLCLDEAITNACEHGCLETAGSVTVSVFAEPPGWVLRVCDQGPGYSATDIDEGETDPYAEGGAGSRFSMDTPNASSWPPGGVSSRCGCKWAQENPRGEGAPLGLRHFGSREARCPGPRGDLC